MIRTIAILTNILFLWASVATAGDQFVQQLKLAERLEKEGRLEDALKAYQGLLPEGSESPQLLDRIQGILKELKRYPQLIEFINQRLEKTPGDLDLHMALGEGFFLSGQVQEARETWLKAVQLSPKEEGSYIRVSDAFLERGMLAEAAEVFLEGRRNLGDTALFAERLAQIYELGGDYRAATQEYLIWLGQDARQLRYVSSRMAQFPEDPEVEKTVEETLMSAVAAEPDQFAFRHLLGYHLTRAGKPDQAYQQFLLLDDREKDSRGGILTEFAQRCTELGYHEVAIQSCREVVKRYPEAPIARSAQLVVGNNLAALERYQEALVAYEELIQRHPTSSESAEAMYLTGEIYFLHLDDVQSALATYRALVAEGGGEPRRIDAAFRIGDCLTAQGDLEGARAEYQRIALKHVPEAVREKVAYKLAELLLLAGKLQEAKEGFDKLVSDFPQGFYVNDALVYAMLLDEGLSEGKGSMEAYVGALGLEIQRKYHQALEAYQQALDQFPSSSVNDEILIQMALVREKIGQHQQALADLEKLIVTYPQSRLCPEAQRRIGQIYELRLQDLPKAIEAYQQVLSNYPRYLFYDDVRRKIRRLRGEGAG